MTTVIGLDPSLTASGIATGYTDPWVIKSKYKSMARIADIRDELRTAIGTPTDDIVVIEGYSMGSHNSHSHELGELGGVIRMWLYENGVKWVDVPPTTLKLFLTGKGNASKDDMIGAAVRLGCPVSNNNAVDAWALRQLGLYHYAALGVPAADLVCQPTEYRARAMAKLVWP